MRQQMPPRHLEAGILSMVTNIAENDRHTHTACNCAQVPPHRRRPTTQQSLVDHLLWPRRCPQRWRCRRNSTWSWPREAPTCAAGRSTKAEQGALLQAPSVGDADLLTLPPA